MEDKQGEVLTDSVTVSIVSQLATITGQNEVDIEPLYDSIDPCALERLAQEDVTISFSHMGYSIIVSGGEVTVTNSQNADSHLGR